MNCQDIWEDILFGTAFLEQRPDFRFDAALYRHVYSDMREAEDVASHFEGFGRAEGRVGNLYQTLIREAPEIEGRLRRLVCDPRLGDAFEAGLEDAAELAFELIALGDPIDHKVSDFSAAHYMKIYPDLAGSRINPLAHYIKFGVTEGRRSLAELRRNRAGGHRRYDPARDTVLVCSHELSGTGAPRVALQLAESAAETHNVVVAALRPGKLLDRFKEHATLVMWSDRPADEIDYLAPELFENIDFAILNSVECYPFVEYLVGKGIPFASYIHEFIEYSLPHYKNLNTALFSDQLYLSSRSLYRSWLPVFSDIDLAFDPATRIMPQGKFEISPIGHDDYVQARRTLSELFSTDCTNKKIVYGAGEAQWRKGTDIFFMLAMQCRHTDPDTIFVWIGDGVNHEDFHFGVWLEKHMREAGVNEPGGNAFHLPAGPYYFDICRAADALFLSSRFDPLPNVVFDATKSGCGVIIFEGGSGFDDPAYLSSGVVRKVPYGNLVEAGEAVLSAPRKRIHKGMVGVPPVGAAPLPPEGVGFLDVAAHEVFATMAGALAQTLERTPPCETDGAYDVSLLFDADADPEQRRKERQKLIRYDRLGIWPSREAAEARLAASDNFVHRRIRIASYARLSPLRHEPFSIHVHAYYVDALEADLAEYVAFREAERVLATTDTDEKAEALQDLGRAAGVGIDVRVVENRGRDILPFLALADDADLVGADDLWCHVHLKKSVGVGLGDRADRWRRFLMRILLGDEEALSSAVALVAQPNVGLVGAFDPYVMGWTGSRRLLAMAQQHFGEALPDHPLLFPMGNMFWARGHVVRAMRGLFGPDYPYPNEPIPNDGTEFHLIERLWPAVAAREGLDSVFLDKPGEPRS